MSSYEPPIHCPFCGKTDVVAVEEFHIDMTIRVLTYFAVKCFDCDICGPMELDRAAAIKGWNRREKPE